MKSIFDNYQSVAKPFVNYMENSFIFKFKFGKHDK